MSFIDAVLVVFILAVAGWIIYSFLFRRKGACAGCTACTCGKDGEKACGEPACSPAGSPDKAGPDGKALIRLAVVSVCVLFVSTSAWAGHPLVTDDAGTLGKGKAQVEIGTQLWRHKDVVDATTTDKSEGGEVAASVGIGLHDRVDLVIGVPYVWQSLDTNDAFVSRADGIGDVNLDIKWRFFEHEGWGLALKPGITFPTGDENQGLGDGRTSYRLFLIGSRELGPVALHANMGYLRSPNGAGNHQDLWHASLAAEYEFVKDWKLMADVGASRNPTPGDGTHPAYALGGVAYAVTEKIRLDGGIKFGLNKAETDITYLFGVTFQF
jgi:hypothetical protein